MKKKKTQKKCLRRQNSKKKKHRDDDKFYAKSKKENHKNWNIFVGRELETKLNRRAEFHPSPEKSGNIFKSNGKQIKWGGRGGTKAKWNFLFLLLWWHFSCGLFFSLVFFFSFSLLVISSIVCGLFLLFWGLAVTFINLDLKFFSIGLIL